MTQRYNNRLGFNSNMNADRAQKQTTLHFIDTLNALYDKQITATVQKDKCKYCIIIYNYVYANLDFIFERVLTKPDNLIRFCKHITNGCHSILQQLSGLISPIINDARHATCVLLTAFEPRLATFMQVHAAPMQQ